MSGIVEFSREMQGFELFPRQAEILGEIYDDNIETAVLRLGRRSGKGRMAATLAVYEATVNAEAHLSAVAPGERVVIAVVAKAQHQARVVHRFVAGFVNAVARRTPRLQVVRESQDEIELSNGMTIMTMPADAASLRGPAVAVVIMDEAAHFAGRDGSVLDPKEIFEALAPATAQFPARRILVLSTPRYSSGWFFDLCNAAASGQYPEMRTWHATTAEMNPQISRGWLEREEAKDPSYFRREYGAEFESGVGSVFDAQLVRASIREVADIAPKPGDEYLLAVDPAYVGDTFAVLVGHPEPGGQIVVDVVRGWSGTRADPVIIDSALDSIAALSQAYGHAPVITDQATAQTILQGLANRGVHAYQQDWTNATKVDAVAAVRRVLYARRLSIPDHKVLVSELVQLEQRLTPGGRPHIAAPGRAHDDYATALMALVRQLELPEDDEQTWFYDSYTGEFVDDPSKLSEPDPWSFGRALPAGARALQDDEIGWRRPGY